MIIESAFMKLPEILENCDITEESEREVQNAIAMSILQELSIRNIKNPLNRIHVEKNYNKDILKKCDLYVDFRGVYQHDLIGYKTFEKNWIEIKHYKTGKGSHTKTENLSQVAHEIERLLKYTKSNEGRYLLITGDRKITNFLTYTKDTFVKDVFINKKIGNLHYDFSNKPKSFKWAFESRKNIILDFNIIRTLFFESNKGYSGYLIQFTNAD